MGTLATGLAGKRIDTRGDLYRAEVTGDIEKVDGVLRITRIDVTYHLKAAKEKQSDALEALESYLQFCPAAQSVSGCIDIDHRIVFEA